MIALLLLQAVFVVDDGGGPGVDFTDIPPAIAAAADGDLLLVKAGLYSNFTLNGKGLRILGEGPTTRVALNGVPPTSIATISNVPAGSFAYVEAMRFGGNPTSPSGGGLTVLGASTRVVLADISIPALWDPGASALTVSGAEVHVHRSQLTGAPGSGGFLFGFLSGGSGISVTDGGRVEASSCDLFGGPGGSGSCLGGLGGFCGTGGGAGAFVTASTTPSRLWMADSTAFGAVGSMAGSCSCASSYGGPGVSVGNSAARFSGPTLLQGADGASCFFVSPPGPALVLGGTATAEVHPGTVFTPGTDGCGLPVPPTVGSGITFSPQPLPVLTVSGPLTTAGSVTISLANGPADAPFLLVGSLAPGYSPDVSGFLGEILIDTAAWFPVATGNLTPTGAWSVTLPLAGLPPALVHRPICLQAVALHASGAFFLASNSTVATVRS